MLFVVSLKEIREKKILIESDTVDKALQIVEHNYDYGDDEFVLSDDDIIHVECIAERFKNG